MTDQAARFDKLAAGYERWWAPVLAPSAVALLDRLEAPIAGRGGHLLDVGVGTGNLSIAALRRWPDIRITGIDASREMVGAVEALVAERLPASDGDRFEARVAFADDLPFGDASIDAAMSSFVLQLVPNRARALREIRRVLRPGGTLAYVTWMGEDRSFAPDRVFDQLLAEVGFEEEPGDGRVGDVPSVAVAIGELRRAGFRAVEAEAGELAYAFTVDSYLSFLMEFDAETTFEEMPRDERRRFGATLRERLMALPAADLTFRAGIVYATGIRSDG